MRNTSYFDVEINCGFQQVFSFVFSLEELKIRIDRQKVS